MRRAASAIVGTISALIVDGPAPEAVSRLAFCCQPGPDALVHLAQRATGRRDFRAQGVDLRRRQFEAGASQEMREFRHARFRLAHRRPPTITMIARE
jgi:hypothetical protein